MRAFASSVNRHPRSPLLVAYPVDMGAPSLLRGYVSPGSQTRYLPQQLVCSCCLALLRFATAMMPIRLNL